MVEWVKESLNMEGEKGTVCVTGAGGYIASWLVKLLLSNGYKVHGTVRDPNDAKNAHLMKLDKATENLKLYRADLLDYDSLLSAFDGCEGVFHTATPVPYNKIVNPEVEIITPIVTGTLNVLKGCLEGKIRRVVMVSSVAAVRQNPSWSVDQEIDEGCWSDKEYCKRSELWYPYAKTVSEETALRYGQEMGLDVVTVIPAMVIGPMLQSTVNSSSLWHINLMKGILEVYKNPGSYVDVRDLADALLLVYEKPEATGRYLCASCLMTMSNFIEKLKSVYPNYKYPTCDDYASVKRGVSSEKLKALGWKFRNIDNMIKETVEFFQEKGYLDM